MKASNTVTNNYIYHFYLLQKIVIQNPNGYDFVVRTCGPPCNETVSGNTLTTCCENDDLCNDGLSTLFGSDHSLHRTLRIIVAVFVILWINIFFER